MPAAVLARLVLLEARRGGLPWLALGCIAVGVSLAAFLSQVAVTESRMLQAALLAAVLRAGAVFLIAAQVAGSTLREMNDRALELALSLPVSRLAQYLGRLAGFAACAAALALECTLVAAATLFFALALGQLVPAIAAVAGLYLLGRSMAAIQAIAAAPLAESSLAQDIARWGVDAVAFLLPRLDAVTRTDWLLYEAPAPADALAALAGLAVYLALLVAAGLFDFYRRNL